MTRDRVVRVSRRLRPIGFYAAVTAVSAPFVLVFVYMAATSLQSPHDIAKPGVRLLFKPTLDNYRQVFAENDIASFALNSFVIAATSTSIALLLGAPAAFALVHCRLNRIAVVILLSRITPGITLLLPWFIIFTNLGWIDTYKALVLAHLVINLPLVIWMLSNFFQDVPGELIEAARVDGATTQRAFVSVILPTVRAGMAAVGVLAFILSWNSFLFSVVLSVDRTKTLPVAAFNFMSYGSVQWGAIAAVAVIMTLPVVVLALLAQRQIIAGLSGRIEV